MPRFRTRQVLVLLFGLTMVPMVGPVVVTGCSRTAPPAAAEVESNGHEPVSPAEAEVEPGAKTPAAPAKDDEQPPAAPPEQPPVAPEPPSVTVINGNDLSLHAGERVQVIGRLGGRPGQQKVLPPDGHPHVHVVDVDTKPVVVYTATPIEGPLKKCELVLTGTVLDQTSPAKDGGGSGRIYEPRRQFDLQVDEVRCAPAAEPSAPEP